jgi:hypothetical protein
MSRLSPASRRALRRARRANVRIFASFGGDWGGFTGWVASVCRDGCMAPTPQDAAPTRSEAIRRAGRPHRSRRGIRAWNYCRGRARR